INFDRSKFQLLNKQRDGIAEECKLLSKEIESLREKWNEESKEQFDASKVELDPEVCPTCNQQLPNQDVENLKEKAINDFNAHKEKNLKSINGLGKSLKA